MNKSLLVLCAGLVIAAGLFAETTRTWEQQGYEDFEKGNLERLSLSSEGRLQLAPHFRQLADPGLNYVWAVAEDKRGYVYMGGGTPGKVVRVNLAKGRKETAVTPETVLTAKELQVQALAVDDDNNVYAATSPDPKVYKITPDGKSSLFFEPKAKYVWAMVFDRSGHLLVGTGDKGEIFSVDRKGQGKVFYNSDEVHARSLALDHQGNVILGTDPGGLIIRISPEGQPFILYQAPKKEVTALEIGPDGSIYASAVGDKTKAATLSAPIAQPTITISPTPVMVGTQSAPAVAGGSEVYRIFPDGEPRRIWASREEAVYSLSARPNGSLLVATGNKGRIYQVDSPDVYTNLVKAQATQVTAFLKLRGGEILAATGNSGKLMEIGNEYESDGSFESEVFDAHNFARWGRLAWRAETFPGTTVTFYTRSGNVDNPDRNWSPWSAAMASPGARSDSPGARFVQWKAVLTSKEGHTTPWLDSVEIAYLPKNLPPAIDEVEATPAGYKFQAALSGTPQAPAATMTLPPLGRQAPRPAPPAVAVHFEAATTMQQHHGWQGVRWAAHDDNDDTLVYSVWIRGANEHNWKLLKDKVNEKFYAWDATSFPDGTYFVKVVASDEPSNTEGAALTDTHESGPFVIDNTPPDITNMNAAYEGGKLHVTLRASDALSTISKAEYSVDGSDWRLVLPVGQLSDAPQESYDFALDAKPGEHTVAVRVYDKVENFAVAKAVTK